MANGFSDTVTHGFNCICDAVAYGHSNVNSYSHSYAYGSGFYRYSNSDRDPVANGYSQSIAFSSTRRSYYWDVERQSG
jgi:hypothetical protein